MVMDKYLTVAFILYAINAYGYATDKHIINCVFAIITIAFILYNYRKSYIEIGIIGAVSINASYAIYRLI